MTAYSTWQRFRVPLLWAGAIGFGLLGATGARNYIAGEVDAAKRRLAGNERWVEVIVAKRPLQAGETISPQTMAIRKLAAAGLPGGVVGPGEFDSFDGQSLAQAMQAGEPLFASIVAHRNSASLSSRIPAGTRAMTVSVDEVNSVSGMLRPGDRIDLMFSIRAQSGAMRAPSDLATPLMADLLVLATGKRTERSVDVTTGAGRYSAITVEVTPAQAQRLILAQRSGRITALLRRPGDHALPEHGALDLDQLLGVVRRASDFRPEVIVGGRGPLLQGPQAPPTRLASAPGER